MKQTIAVLGAGGFFGARLVEMAQARADVEIIPVLRSYRSLARISKLNVRARRANTEDPSSLAEAFAGCDTVLNTTTGDWLGAQPDAERFLTAARQAGVRLFVHMSSAAIFGSVENSAINDDSKPEGAEWFLYATEKGRADEFLRAQMGKDSPRIVVLRPCLIWGPRSSWVTRPAKELLMDKAWLTNNGEGICNLCHTDNLARYVFQVVMSTSEQSGFYNVADTETITWRQYYEALAAGLGLPSDRVHLCTSQPLRLSSAVAVEWIKSQRLGYRFARWLTNHWSAENKSLLKWHLPALAGGGVAPPLNPNDSLPRHLPPRFTRETWSAHHTRQKLPSDKFWRDFGQPQLISFDDAMRGTIGWLRFAGYADY
jgi:nucleoside-diphosphate-sugar epimerase